MKVAKSGSSTAHPCLADEVFMASLREQMLRFSRLQLGDQALAEDAVQEAFAGALKNAGSFAGSSALKTWIFAILKNKIADLLRRKKRESPMSDLVRDDDDDDFSALFNRKGFWHAEERPVAWSEPEQYLENDHFWVVFEACLDHLPPKQARVFMMREFVELETSEICEAASLSVSNLHVLLHRARLRLRECLENKWFLGGPCSC
jgi:RNA polymerase sigma-70 factor (TIGR02943 family)